jgi:hypothetical protein
MVKFTLLGNLLLIYLLLMGALQGCGKKVVSDNSTYESRRESQTDLEEYLQKQDVNCENNQPCPSYISKMVVSSENKITFCTGFLIDQTTVATSASCLPNLLRLSGQDCSRDIFFFFPKTANRPAERVGCSRVSFISQIEGQDPLLWRDDVAYLELSDKVMYRREAQIVREGIDQTKQYFSWTVVQEDQYSAIIKKSTCEGIHNSYVNPLATNESSPNVLFSDCHLNNGSTGAPVVDIRGKVRAIISKGMNPKLRSYLDSTGLLSQALKEISHATNFACAPTPTDSQMLDERECLKELSYSKVDQLRGEMLSSQQIFGELRRKYEESIRNLSPFVQLGINLLSKGDFQNVEVVPKCFKPLRNWLPNIGQGRSTFVEEVLIPYKTFKRSMDSHGRIYGNVLEGPKKEIFIQFSLKNLRITGKSSILMWGQGESEINTFSNISDNCPSLL